MNIRYFFISFFIFTSCFSMDRTLSTMIARNTELLDAHVHSNPRLLASAMLTRNIKLLDTYIRSKPRSFLNERQGDLKRTLLFDACAMGADSAVRLLIRRGADVNIPDIHGNTPLIASLGAGRNAGIIAKILIENGADVNAHGIRGNTALHFVDGRTACAKSLLEHGANPNATTEDGATPLYLACCRGVLPVIEMLLRYNARNIACNDGSTPLQAAREKGYSAVVRLLTTGRLEIPQYDADGYTALFRACKEGRIDEVERLIAQGADVNAFNQYSRETPLIVACYIKRADIVRLLVKHGADVNIAARDYSPLMVACKCGTPEMAHFLLDEGVDPHWESADCHANALHCACIQGNLDIIRRLILDFEVRTVTRTRCIERGNEVVYKTPLELAKAYHHDDVAAFIIDPHW